MLQNNFGSAKSLQCLYLFVIVHCYLSPLGVLTHAGFFYMVRIRMGIPPVLPHHVAYILRNGPAFDTFYSLAKLAFKTKLFGIYYDDPDVVRNLVFVLNQNCKTFQNSRTTKYSLFFPFHLSKNTSGRRFIFYIPTLFFKFMTNLQLDYPDNK